ncbi:hypothetical protein G8S49_07790 [Clostridium botulinum C]|uniref:Peptidase S1 domain-containing protein n=2 Tax=Clostridium botulinum TaxID=1491 RepID=A0A9Q4XUJ3_CLOBO|nr:hypothetical protein [Clostridium botulinum]EGO89287.1 hypothetical protein CBCST_00235 [Clostridium botulinum C str. Stockholm]MCD3195271.1 hypothetical protein [Clostridium botulinum C]MCD3200609.1 hypothetical protein [Clostridium botulinum C]MCD3206017.1 hypothetical protein [Clostridium botulinum C]MCD3208506.1 hypothetical protein [Clostridium botulinum C]
MILSKNNYDTKESKLEQNISNICNCEYKYFLNKSNVVGVGCGYKIKKGFYTNQLCVQVFVSKKCPENQLNSNDMIPLMYKGIPTDVKETGYFSPCSFNIKERPVPGGYGISANMSEIIGTAGCVVSNGVSRFVLGTNHVLSNVNMLPMKTPIVQPDYAHDGYAPTDTFATLYKYIPLRFIKGEDRPINLTDCAIGLLTKSNIMSNKIAFIGKVSHIKSPKLNASVKKVGTTTEFTRGFITSTSAVVVINYNNGKRAFFKDQIFTTYMAQKGDSGAILVDDNNFALGLLCGYSPNVTTFNRLSTVLEQLDVSLSY